MEDVGTASSSSTSATWDAGADSLMSSRSLESAGIGGGGLEVSMNGGAGGGDGFKACVSTGPGPGTLTEEVGCGGRVSGISTAREWAFNAGVSTNAFPAAFRIKVCKVHHQQRSSAVQAPLTSGFLWYMLPKVPVCSSS